MEAAKITSLVVVDAEAEVLGVIHLHDVLQALEISLTRPRQP
jgi:CBS domain-containing protein